MNTGKIFNSKFDIKLGYSCNNHCIHCVINPMVEDLVKCNKRIDLNYAEISSIINSNDFAEAKLIVLTGGEPTLRKDFMRIVKTISNKYPDKDIALQTNGRLLYKYVDEIKKLPNKFYYVVAIHSIDKDVHNIIVNNRVKDGNSYEETITSLLKLRDSYPNFKDIGRIEIVLSKYNYKTLYKTIVELHKMGINSIGVSYPHLDGYYVNDGVEKIREISLSYGELKSILPEINDYLTANKDLELGFEEVPKCVWRDSNDELLPIAFNILTGDDSCGYTKVKYPGREVDTDFSQIWSRMHCKPDTCKKCTLNKCCCGIWGEALKAFGNDGLIPII